MRTFILMFLFLVKLAFAAETPLHQQQIENAAPTQTAIDLSAKKLREHKDIEIGEKLVIPPFHKQAGDLETAPQSFCRTCHTPLPHQKALRTRTFNNMHVKFIACETCHVENEKLSFQSVWNIISSSSGLLHSSDVEQVFDIFEITSLSFI